MNLRPLGYERGEADPDGLCWTRLDGYSCRSQRCGVRRRAPASRSVQASLPTFCLQNRGGRRADGPLINTIVSAVPGRDRRGQPLGFWHYMFRTSCGRALPLPLQARPGWDAWSLGSTTSDLIFSPCLAYICMGRSEDLVTRSRRWAGGSRSTGRPVDLGVRCGVGEQAQGRRRHCPLRRELPRPHRR